MTPAPTVTIATSTGPVWLALLVHVFGGSIALLSGFIAILVTKGGPWHRRAGMGFVVSMIVMGLFGAAVATYEMKVTAAGGILSVYLVFTGLTTVRPFRGPGQLQQLALMIVALVVAAFELTVGVVALGTPLGMINGVPAGMILFMSTIALAAAIGDWRMIRGGGIQGTRRLARHLWRMCFALFIASGSFFFGQTKFVPAPLRILPLLSVLGVAPLIVLLYWMWRVRLRHSLRGMTIGGARALAKQS